MPMKRFLMALVVTGCLLIPGVAAAEGFELKSAATIREVLADSVGKRVALQLGGTEEVEGTVTRVGDTLVHVSRLVGREFYDAVIRIDAIKAVRLRARDKV